MKINYHTHTNRCKHAVGTDREYIESAIGMGLTTIGFSDHAPFLYPDSYISYYKMEPYGIDEYFESLLSLREEYRGRIDIRIGFEAEYYEDIFPETLALWRNYPVEYLILGQHVLYNEYDKTRIPAIDYTEDTAHLEEYTDKVLRGLRTGRFSILAHPDLINYHGNMDLYRDRMAQIIRTSKEYGVAVELNLLGIRARRNYPSDDFWSLVADISPTVVMGCDSHDPRDVATRENVEAGRRYLSRFGITPAEEIELRNPLFFAE